MATRETAQISRSLGNSSTLRLVISKIQQKFHLFQFPFKIFLPVYISDSIVYPEISHSRAHFQNSNSYEFIAVYVSTRFLFFSLARGLCLLANNFNLTIVYYTHLNTCIRVCMEIHYSPNMEPLFTKFFRTSLPATTTEMTSFCTKFALDARKLEFSFKNNKNHGIWREKNLSGFRIKFPIKLVSFVTK